MDERLYWLGWQFLLPGLARRVWALIRHFGTPRAAWEAPAGEMIGIDGMREETVRELAARRDALDPVREASSLRNAGISFTVYGEPGYPTALEHIYDPPPALFFRGTLDSRDKICVALVGSRRPTPYGLAVAEKLAGDLAKVGVTVVSGMARGVDTAAHRGAMKAGGRTLAVLGCGVDVCYPPENRKVMERIIAAGAVISEFPPGAPPQAWHFPVRNRIISGLSRATVIVEAGEKSGALITADLALEQGRDVMAVPGPVTNRMSRGPHRLIKQGARLVESAVDILEELGLENLFPDVDGCSAGEVQLSGEERLIRSLLGFEPVPLDSLIQKSGLPPGQVMAALMYLEVKGLVRCLPGKFYVNIK